MRDKIFIAKKYKVTEEELKEAGKFGVGVTRKEKYALRYGSDLPLSDRAMKIVEGMSDSLLFDFFWSGYQKIMRAKARAEK